MNFTILGPAENPVQDSKSDATDGNFGGNRAVTEDNNASAHDYKKAGGNAPNKKENPVDTVEKDIDEIEHIEDTTTAPADKEADFITKSDTDSIPGEEMDSKSKLPHHVGEGQYDNMPNRSPN